ncbi:MAG: RES family NAD+ phosphorylase [Pelodictyon phaeoclathratiforme]|nr:RES family NAD+ phosphorylase [Pelodictyon phaeoclathratiforme]
MVEAQHVVSTMKIVDSLAEQALLEEILEQGKPPVPTETAGLHYLLSTPFRYKTLYPKGSRFRAPSDPGVFYGAERVKTAAAEIGYHRWQFLQDSLNLDRLPPAQFTAFSVQVKGIMVDLRLAPFKKDTLFWTDPGNYSATQAFAKVARQASLSAILYHSVRDPKPHCCTAVLTPGAFAAKNPDKPMQTLTLTILQKEAVWQGQRIQSFAFNPAFWANPLI